MRLLEVPIMEDVCVFINIQQKCVCVCVCVCCRAAGKSDRHIPSGIRVYKGAGNAPQNNPRLRAYSHREKVEAKAKKFH